MANGFNISGFRSSIAKSNVLKNNKFLFRISPPRAFIAGGGNLAQLSVASRDIELWCDSTNIPGAALETIPHKRYGYGNYEKRPFNTTFNDITMTFIGDGNGVVWTFFQQWIQLISHYDMRAGINSKSNGILPSSSPYEIAYKMDYAVNAELIMFDDKGIEKIHIHFNEIFPVILGDVQLNWGDTNNIMRVPVSFTYLNWYNDKSYATKKTRSPLYPDTILPDAWRNNEVFRPSALTLDNIQKGLNAVGTSFKDALAGFF